MGWEGAGLHPIEGRNASYGYINHQKGESLPDANIIQNACRKLSTLAISLSKIRAQIFKISTN